MPDGSRGRASAGHRMAVRQRAFWLILATLIVVPDQVSKAWVAARLEVGERIALLPILDLTYSLNTGAAFSFLASAGGWQRGFLVLVAVVVSSILVVWIGRLRQEEGRLGLALALVLGGALGNLADRVRLGHVEDFVLLHWNNWYFPAFNVADAAITVGAVLLVLDAFLPGRSDDRARRESK